MGKVKTTLATIGVLTALAVTGGSATFGVVANNNLQKQIQENEELKQTNITIKAENTTLKKDKTTLQNNLTTTQNALDLAETRLLDIETELEDKTTRLAEIEEELATSESNNETLKNEKLELQNDIATLTNEKTTLNTQVTSLNITIEELNARITELENKLSFTLLPGTYTSSNGDYYVIEENGVISDGQKGNWSIEHGFALNGYTLEKDVLTITWNCFGDIQMIKYSMTANNEFVDSDGNIFSLPTSQLISISESLCGIYEMYITTLEDPNSAMGTVPYIAYVRVNSDKTVDIKIRAEEGATGGSVYEKYGVTTLNSYGDTISIDATLDMPILSKLEGFTITLTPTINDEEIYYADVSGTRLQKITKIPGLSGNYYEFDDFVDGSWVDYE